MAFTARTAALGEQDAVLQERLDEVARQNGEAIHPIDKKKNIYAFYWLFRWRRSGTDSHFTYFFFGFRVLIHLLLILMSNKTHEQLGLGRRSSSCGTRWPRRLESSSVELDIICWVYDQWSLCDYRESPEDLWWFMHKLRIMKLY